MDGARAALEAMATDPPRVVCLPDLFVDHLVQLPDLQATLATLQDIHDQGGGNRQAPQRILAGGNAANTAMALARLGVDAALIGRTGALGHDLAQATLGAHGVDLTGLRRDGRTALTVALELAPEPTNIMFNDPGSLATYGPADLTDRDRRAIREADAVLMANWNNLREHGTELMATVCQVASRAGTLTYADPSDVATKPEAIPGFLEQVACSTELDVLAINEHELAELAGQGSIKEAGAQLTSRMTATLDVHTTSHAYTWGKGEVCDAAGFEVTARTSTGAGDAWNAGNLIGHLAGLQPRQRLRLAHAVASLTVTSTDASPPGRTEVLGLLDA